MINKIKNKWSFFLIFAIAAIITSWLLYTKVSDLYKFNMKIKLILKQNKRVEAVVIEKHRIMMRAGYIYWFKTDQGIKYYARLSKFFNYPDVGDKLVILIADDIKLCLIEDIKYKQISGYKYYLFYSISILGLSFVFSMFMLIILILDMSGKI